MSLVSVATQLPFLLVWLAGAVVAMVRWERHPLVSGLVLVGAGIEVLMGVARIALPMMAQQRGMPISQMGLVYGGLGCVSEIAIGLVLTAVFIERTGAATPQRPMPPEMK